MWADFKSCFAADQQKEDAFIEHCFGGLDWEKVEEFLIRANSRLGDHKVFFESNEFKFMILIETEQFVNA